MTKRKTYHDEYRASAVLMLESQGYPQTKGALTAVSRHLGVPCATLSRWFKGKNNPPPINLVNEKRQGWRNRLDEVLDTLIDEMLGAVTDAPLREIATAFGIVADKQFLLSGQPTNRQEVTIHDNLTDDERMARVAALFDAARTRRDSNSLREVVH